MDNIQTAFYKDIITDAFKHDLQAPYIGMQEVNGQVYIGIVIDDSYAINFFLATVQAIAKENLADVCPLATYLTAEFDCTVAFLYNPKAPIDSWIAEDLNDFMQDVRL